MHVRCKQAQIKNHWVSHFHWCAIDKMMNGLINASFLLVFWLHTNGFCRRNPATSWKMEAVRGKAVVHGSKVLDHKTERERNDSVMSTDIQRQADRSEESVYRHVAWSDQCSRQQTERQVCDSEWQGCLEDYTSDALIKTAGFHSTFCACARTWSHAFAQTWSETLPFFIISCLLLSPHIIRIIQEALLVSQHPADPPPLPSKRLLPSAWP